MRKTMKLITVVSMIGLSLSAVLAQRPRTISQDSTGTTTSVPPPAPAPENVKAKYEGGVFGHPNKMEGSLSLDDPNQRLVFRDKKNKEVFSIPYNSLTGAYADTHAVQPAAATVATHVPYVGLPASLIKTKVRYLTLQFSDPDSNVSGATSFRLENQEILDSMLNTVANRAGLTQRGGVYIKKKP
jgi:hypothetical protein